MHIFTKNFFKKRQACLKKALKAKEALLLFAPPVYFRQTDVNFPFRQDSNFFYLTGFEEEGSAFLFVPNRLHESSLFLKPKDPKKELWTGPTISPENAKKNIAVKSVFEINDLEKELKKQLSGIKTLYVNEHPLLKNLQARLPKEITISTHINQIMTKLRLSKTPEEIKCMKKAAQITIKAHKDVMKQARFCKTESALYGIFLKSLLEQGSLRESYNGIFASGANAITLHYTKNSDKIKTQDLILVDAGAEYSYYASDITRCFPASGRFNKKLKIFYNKILNAQKQLIKKTMAGVLFKDLQKLCAELLSEVLIEEKILKSPLKTVLKEGLYKKYFPHGLGHSLGLDVHDPANLKDKAFKLQSSQIFTIEPGLYFNPNDKNVPTYLKGVGIRIEDNVLIQSNSCQNLTLKAPKDTDAIEDLMNS